jgi:hypothetical protein
MRHRPWRLKPDRLGRLVELATQILVFAEQPQPERLPLTHVCTAQHGLIDPVKAIIESIFERPATGIEIRTRQ